MNLYTNVVKNNVSTIYVETSILLHERTQEILSYFPNATMIQIHDYRDVFNRKRQSVSFQKQSQNIILAKKKKDFVYHGSPVCQSFDERYFYYASSVMNCVYDCEYCFLKGMYPSANLVIFVNLEDFFEEVEKKLLEHPMYICVSYDADMLALESILHYGKLWADFCIRHENLTIEIRTKGTFSSSWQTIQANERVIMAFTLSPQYVIDTYEHKTPNLMQRIQMIQQAQTLHMPIRICIDPIVVFPKWKQAYTDLIQLLDKHIDFSSVKDMSIGTFRISKNYLSLMRQQYPTSAILQYPYVCDHGFYHLPFALQKQIESHVYHCMEQVIDTNKIYVWENTDETSNCNRCK